MAAKYSQSLQDVREGDVVGPGYYSLVNQLQTRSENVKRSPASKRRQQKKVSDEGDTVPLEQNVAVQAV